MGFVDNAGCGAVHLVGAVSGLTAMVFLGPRYSSISIYHPKKLKPVCKPDNEIILIMGGFILWYGWYSFNLISPIAGDVSETHFFNSKKRINLR